MASKTEDRALKAEQQRFQNEVFTILQNFERAKEWPDLSSCLKKLYRAFANAQNSTFFPHPESVNMRLAQCLNPQLPAGIHTNALENYSIILQRIGPDGLCKQLAMISSGLFPFFQNAVSHVKPLFLEIIGRFYLPLGKRLLPCLTALMISLLPGVENEKDDNFDHTWATIQELKNCVGTPNFMYSLWIILLRADRVHYPALHILSDSLSKINHPSAINNLLPYREILFLKASKAILNSTNILVKRLYFDILITHFPLSSKILTNQEKEELIHYGLKLLPTCEWTITRRFITWLTNLSDSLDNNNDLTYFFKYASSSLTATLIKAFNTHTYNETTALTPLKMLTKLVTDEELEGLSNALMPDLTFTVLSYIEREAMDKQWSEKVMKEAHTLYNPNLTNPKSIWESLSNSISEGDLNTQKKQGQLVNILSMSIFYVEHVCTNISNSDSLSGLFLLISKTLDLLCDVENPTSILINNIEVLSILLKCFNKITKLKNSLRNEQAIIDHSEDINATNSTNNLKEQIDEFSSNFIENDEIYFKRAIKIFEIFVRKIFDELKTSNFDNFDVFLSGLSLLGPILVTIYQFEKLGGVNSSKNELFDNSIEWFTALLECCLHTNIQICCICVQTLILIIKECFYEQRIQIITIYFEYWESLNIHLWEFLSEEYNGSYAEVVNLLLYLHDLSEGLATKSYSQESVLDGILISSLSNKNYIEKAKYIQNFSIFWKYSHILRPDDVIFSGVILQIFDYLDDPEPLTRFAAQKWSSEAIQNLPHLINPLFKYLFYERPDNTDHDNVERIKYIFRLLISLLRNDGPTLVEKMQIFYVTEDVLGMNIIHNGSLLEGRIDIPNIFTHTHNKDKIPTHQIRHNSRTLKEAIIELNSTHTPIEWCKNSTDFGIHGDPRDGSYEATVLVDYIDLFIVTSLRFMNIHFTHQNDNYKTFNYTHFDDQISDVRPIALEFLKIFLGNIQPHTRAREASSMISYPLLILLKTVIDRGDLAIQLQVLNLLRLVMKKTNINDKSLSPSTLTAISLDLNDTMNDDTHNKVINDTHTHYGITQGSNGVIHTQNKVQTSDATPNSSIYLSTHTKPKYGPHFRVAVESKKTRVRNLRNLADQQLLIPTLISGIEANFDKPHNSAVLEAFIEFLIFTITNTHTNKLTFVATAFLKCFSFLMKTSAHKNHRNSMKIFLDGIINITHFIIEYDMGQIHTPHKNGLPSESGTFTNMLKGIVGGSQTSKEISENKKFDFFGIIFNILLTNLISDSLHTITSSLLHLNIHKEGTHTHTHTSTKPLTHETDDLGGTKGHTTQTNPNEVKGLATDMDINRDKMALLKKIIKFFEKIYEKDPQLFIKACCQIWQNSLDQNDTHLINLLIIIPKMKTFKISKFIQLLFDFITSNEPFGHIKNHTHTFSIITSFHFFTSIITLYKLSPEDEDIAWSCLIKLLYNFHSGSNFKIKFWLFSMILMFDSQHPSTEHLQHHSKKAKRNLSDLVTHIISIAVGKQNSHTSFENELNNNSDYILLPPHLDAFYTTLENNNEIWNWHSNGKQLPRLLSLHTIRSNSTQYKRRNNEVDSNSNVYTFDNSLSYSYNSLIFLNIFTSQVTFLNKRTYISTILIQSLCEGLTSQLLLPLSNHTSQMANQTFWMSNLLINLPFNLYPGCLTSIKKSILEIFNSNLFFKMSHSSLRCWSKLLRVTILNDPQNIEVLVPYTYAGVFTSKEDDIQLRTHHMKRISFLVFSCPNDTFLSQLRFILDRLIDGLRIPGAIKLLEAACLCIRVLLYKIKSSFLTPIWPIILRELIRTVTPPFELDGALIFSGLKIIDLASFLNLQDFHLYQWMFFTDSLEIEDGDDKKLNVEKLLGEDLSDVENNNIDEKYYENDLAFFNNNNNEGKYRDGVRTRNNNNNNISLINDDETNTEASTNFVPFLDILSKSFPSHNFDTPNNNNAENYDIDDLDTKHPKHMLLPLVIDRKSTMKKQIEYSLRLLSQRFSGTIFNDEIDHEAIERSLEVDFLEDISEDNEFNDEYKNYHLINNRLSEIYNTGFSEFSEEVFQGSSVI